MKYVDWINYRKWRNWMPYSRRSREQKPKLPDPAKAMYVYILIKNGVPEGQADPTGIYRRAYKYFVGWKVLVDENGEVLKGPDADIKRLHEEGIL